MTQETLLVSTADNFIVCFNLEYGNMAEKARKTLQYKQFCEHKTYNDVVDAYNQYANGGRQNKDILQQIDTDNMTFLHEELTPYSFFKQPQVFRNELETNNYPPHIAGARNTIHFDNHIPNTEIPEMIQNLGYQITAQDNCYPVQFNTSTQEYEAVGLSLRRATVDSSQKKIEFVRNHFTFPAAEYQRINNMISGFQQARQTNPGLDVFDYMERIQDAKDRSLFSIYAQEYSNVIHRELSLKHEMKHIKNDMLYAGLMQKNEAKRLTVEDTYRFCVEDERSAYLSQAINAINKYLKNGNLNDLTMFDNETRWIADTLRNTPLQDRTRFVTDMPQIMAGSFREFEQNHRQSYDRRQFVDNLQEKIKYAPLSVEEDRNHEEFRRVQSLLYHFKIYNPATGQMEDKNLSQYITPDKQVEITPSLYTSLIAPNKQTMQRRLAEYNRKKSAGEINPELVLAAKSLMRDNLRQPRFVNNVDNLEISDLFQDTPGQTPPGRGQLPDNHAEWSDNLKQYWSQMDGYQEIAKNNFEYTFKVKNDTVRYTAENKAEVSNGAEYDTYVKLLNEPTNKDRPVKFKESLTEEQALKLYVACINSGRRPIGNVPTDLSRVGSLRDIPPAELQKFQQRVAGQNNNGRAQQGTVNRNILIQKTRGGR